MDLFNHIREQPVDDSLTHLYTWHDYRAKLIGLSLGPPYSALSGWTPSLHQRYWLRNSNQLLQAVANRLREQLPETALLARVGGDEFVLLQFDSEDGLDAATCATRVQALFAQPFSSGA